MTTDFNWTCAADLVLASFGSAIAFLGMDDFVA